MLYMQSVGERTKSKSAVEEVYNAIAWAHRVGDQQAPTESAAVKLTLQGLQRQLAKPVQKKKPITAGMLASIVTDAEQSNSGLALLVRPVRPWPYYFSIIPSKS